MRKIPVLFCIDVEPDEREIDLEAPKDWKGFEESYRYFQSVRPRLEEATGAPARFSWFLRMDPQVGRAYGSPGWAAERYRNLLDDLLAAGDELGLHVHAWRWDVGRGRWVADYGDARWVEHCVQTAFGAYEKAFGRACQSFRFGDRWMSDEALDFVERCGAAYDLTPEPGRSALPDVCPGENFTGSFPDYTKLPRVPYHPSPEDFRRDGGARGRAPLLIPLTTVRESWPRAAFYRRAVWRIKYGARQFFPFGPSHQPHLFRRWLDELLCRPETPYLSMLMRSDLAAHPSHGPHFYDNLNWLLTHPRAASMAFDTPAGADEMLRRGVARAGDPCGPRELSARVAETTEVR